MLKYNYIYFIFVSFFLSCKSDLQFSSPITSKAYEAVTTQKTPQNITAFLNAVNKDYDSAKDKLERVEVLKKSLEACQKLGLEKESQNYIYGLLNDDFESAETPKRLFNLAEKIRASGKMLPAEIIYTGLIENFKNSDEASLSKTHIIKSKLELEKILKQLGINIYSTNSALDQTKAKDFINAAEAWAIVFPKDTTSADFLFKAGEVARGTSSWIKSNSLYSNLINKFPNHRHTPVAMFIKGFVLETEFKDAASAKKIFSEFITKFPNHALAKDAKFLIDNSGKDDNELLKEAQKVK